MRIKRFTQTAFLLLSVGLILGSCSKPTRSQKTGIVYNSKTNGGYMRFRKTHPAPGPGLIPIEGGTFVMGGSADQDVAYEYNNTRRRVSVSSFYMDETEISNQDWLDYLHWITLNYPGNREMYYDALPDTLVWRSPLAYNEPYVDNYLRHPAYQDYPVVGVTWSQAQDYCVYRTNAANENILRETGKLASWKEVNTTGKGTDQPYDDGVYLNNQYNGKEGKHAMKDLSAGVRANGGGAAKTNANGKATRPVRMEDGLLLPSFRLPSELEWEYAALGLVGNSQYENIEDGKIYPWNGMGVRSPKRTTRGMIMANFKRGAGDNMGVAGYLNDKADITAPVRSYQPNDFGLYNMAGNVNEWVQDTYRQTSFEEMDDFNGFRGNEFTVKRLADPDKGIYAKDKNGRIIRDAAKANRKQTWAELMAERNGGAPANTTGNAPAQGESTSPLASRAYKADARGYLDSADSKLYGVTTLVNDHSKVYKGGSWNDRAMWLNPATRRFMDQDDASAEVGFRCAMTMIGAAEIHPNGRPHFSVKKPKTFTPKSK